jgi:hypothetical protein
MFRYQYQTGNQLRIPLLLLLSFFSLSHPDSLSFPTKFLSLSSSKRNVLSKQAQLNFGSEKMLIYAPISIVRNRTMLNREQFQLESQITQFSTAEKNFEIGARLSSNSVVAVFFKHFLSQYFN